MLTTLFAGMTRVSEARMQTSDNNGTYAMQRFTVILLFIDMYEYTYIPEEISEISYISSSHQICQTINAHAKSVFLN